MLYGVTSLLRSIFVEADCNMRVFLPFGKHWFDCCTRYINENPKIVYYIVKALFVKGNYQSSLILQNKHGYNGQKKIGNFKFKQLISYLLSKFVCIMYTQNLYHPFQGYRNSHCQ